MRAGEGPGCSDLSAHAGWRYRDPRLALSPEKEDRSGSSCHGGGRIRPRLRVGPHHLLPCDPEQGTPPLGTSVSVSLRWDSCSFPSHRVVARIRCVSAYGVLRTAAGTLNVLSEFLPVIKILKLK